MTDDLKLCPCCGALPIDWTGDPFIAVADLAQAFAPFLDLGPQKGAWGVISKDLDGMAPLTVTVTKDQMLTALGALAKARGET